MLPCKEYSQSSNKTSSSGGSKSVSFKLMAIRKFNQCSVRKISKK